MAKINIKFNNKEYSIDSSVLADATARLEAHLMAMAEERLEGDGAEYYTLAPTALSFRSTAPLSELQEVQINGVTVDPSNYTLEEGSTIVTFPIEYMKTLDKGDYEVTIVSESKSVKGGFTIAAPELNEYGFYYNQPYAAYMDYFNSDVVMFIREDNTMDIMVVANDATETATYAVDGGTLTITSPSMGELHCTFSADGMELYNTELGATLSISNHEAYAADDDYFYTYKEDLGGYEVTAIDKTKSSYSAIRTGVNGIDTVAIGTDAFSPCVSITSIGSVGSGASVEIPASVTIISDGAFGGCTSLTSITLPDSVTNISTHTFALCISLTSITFEGTVEQWNAITFGDYWNSNVPATHVHCIDGDVAL